MAARKGINIFRNYVAPNKLYDFFIYVIKLKGRAKPYFILFLKLNDHPTRYFNFGLSRINLNDCMFKLN